MLNARFNKEWLKNAMLNYAVRGKGTPALDLMDINSDATEKLEYPALRGDEVVIDNVY